MIEIGLRDEVRIRWSSTRVMALLRTVIRWRAAVGWVSSMMIRIIQRVVEEFCLPGISHLHFMSHRTIVSLMMHMMMKRWPIKGWTLDVMIRIAVGKIWMVICMGDMWW